MRVFVTTELHPFTAGGIGRVVANILATSSAAELKETVLVTVGIKAIENTRVQAIYPGVRVFPVFADGYRVIDDAGSLYPPEEAFDDTPWHWQSVHVMQLLKRLDVELGPLHYIEFPDWAGLAFATTQEKRLGRAFLASQIAVRLHSSDGILAAYERRGIDAHALALHDLERKAMADADLVVGQLPSVAQAVADFYQFPETSWTPRLTVHSPPVLLDHPAREDGPLEISNETPIVFSSKIQDFKRPDVFIRGVSGFLRSNPGYQGSVVFLAHSFDERYFSSIQALIPPDQKSRFRFTSFASSSERAAVISRSVCVFPSAYESFCLAAYEASMSGALCLLNRHNPAFEPGTPWEHGKNCITFDGSPNGLCEALMSIFESRPLVGRVVPTQTEAPWSQRTQGGSDAHSSTGSVPSVTAIVTHFNEESTLRGTLQHLLDCGFPKLEIIVVDDASYDPVSKAYIEKLAECQTASFRVIRSPAPGGLARARNFGLAQANGDYVLVVEPGVRISPEFIGLAVKGLQRDPDFDFVVTPCTDFRPGQDPFSGDRDGLRRTRVLIGEAGAIGLHENRYLQGAIFGRTAVLRTLRYREEMDIPEDWDLGMRAVVAGHRILVTSDIHAFREVAGKTRRTPREPSTQELRAAMLRDKRFRIGAIQLPMYAMTPAAAAPVRQDTPPSESSSRHSIERFVARWKRRRNKWKRSIQKRLQRFR
ncbi:glycosyltransferase [Caldimonas brevitalea]|uniref:Glycosyl transferase family protein n=1 Tax=Caldimonas brevitalea TaxID=413882 RepID=A0A0G3BTC7_9BURK|nr:glycosyltransferase [Caldimonas brevitalea]AKJ30631.1 glycosyl transferase family protein [Caldimonas brevitalea]